MEEEINSSTPVPSPPNLEEGTSVVRSGKLGDINLIVCATFGLLVFVLVSFAGAWYYLSHSTSSNFNTGAEINTNELYDLDSSRVAEVAELEESKYLAPGAFMMGDKVYSNYENPEVDKLLFTVDKGTFLPVPDFVGEGRYRPVADGGYVPRWFEDKDYFYCIEGKGVPETVILEQPVEVIYTPTVYTMGQNPTGVWYIEGGSETDGYGELTFYQPETGWIFDIQCKSVGIDQIIQFKDPEVGIAFSYPSEWGPVLVRDEVSGSRAETYEPFDCPKHYNDDPCNLRTYLLKHTVSGFERSSIFMSSETIGHHENPVGRGPFWGDVAGSIDSNYVSKCEESDNCELITNKNGVTFAYYKGVEEPADAVIYSPDRYYLYNPNSPYYGLVLSPQRIESLSSGNIGKEFRNTIIESFSLIK